jgi:rubrerythrin
VLTRIDLSTLSLMDALDLAILIEVEAHERYMAFVSQLGLGGGNTPSTFFYAMAENEAKHGRQLAERRKALFGATPPRVTLDDLFDVEAPEAGAPHRTMSVLQAYEIGLAAEKKAHDFYDLALPHISDPDVRELFAELRDEETDHVRMLEEGIAALPESASIEDELDLDESPSF